MLALTAAAKQLLWWRRFFKQIGFSPNQHFSISCDNHQTVKILTDKNFPFWTSLKHVDIANHWLRQEALNKTIDIQWVPTNKMQADGLTKQFLGQKHAEFIKQLNMVIH